MLRVGPDQQDSVHDWNEQVYHLVKLLSRVCQLIEELQQGLEVQEVLSGFRPGDLNLLLKLAEWTGVGRLVLFQELEHLLDSLGAKLLADGDEILALILPEINLGDWIWVLSVLECALWVSLEHLLDLLAPVDDGSLEQLGLVLAGGLLAGGDIIGREREKGSALHLTDGDVGVGEEPVELVHEILGDKVGPAHHVKRVAEDWHEHLVTDEMEILQDLLVQLHKNDLLVDVVHGDLEGLRQSLGRSGSEAENNLLLDIRWRVSKVADWHS